MEWNGMEWSGMECNVCKYVITFFKRSIIILRIYKRTIPHSYVTNKRDRGFSNGRLTRPALSFRPMLDRAAAPWERHSGPAGVSSRFRWMRWWFVVDVGKASMVHKTPKILMVFTINRNCRFWDGLLHYCFTNLFYSLPTWFEFFKYYYDHSCNI